MKGKMGDDNDIIMIYKENHSSKAGDNKGKYNIKVELEYKSAGDGRDAEYNGNVYIGSEDNHERSVKVEKLEGVKYQNTDVLKKYKPGGALIQAIGSYQDTKDGGVRFKLDVQDPETKEWKRIFDHVDYGDEHHDIKNYRGKSAVASAIRIDGSVGNWTEDDEDALKNLEEKPVNVQKSPKQQEVLSRLGYCDITFKEIGPDDGTEEPLSRGKKV
jgi:hypothetical protein